MKLLTLCAYDDPKRMRRGLLNVALMAAFARRVYPAIEVYFMFREGQVVDPKIAAHAIPLQTGFKQERLGYQRMMAQAAFADAKWEANEDIIFCGTDVAILRPIEWPGMENFAGAYAYRYHPAMPYNDDFSYWIGRRREDALRVMNEIVLCAKWMPPDNEKVFAGQIALGTVLGCPTNWGGLIPTPRKPEIAALPAVDYLYTPEDYFPMRPEDFRGGEVVTAPFRQSFFESYFNSKYTLHFKGEYKKRWLLEFAKWSWQQGLIDPFINDLAAPEEMFGDIP